MQTVESSTTARGLRIAVVVARVNDFVTDRLRDGALEALTAAGASPQSIAVLPVPGSFEIPLAAHRAAESGAFDAVICLGCVIRGETPHFEYIASAVAHGITAAAAATGVPITFGVLTTRLRRGGARAGRRRTREQGVGSGDGRRRNGQVAPALGRGERRGAGSVMARGRRDKRHRGREAALQLLYQWEMSGAADMEGAIESFALLQPAADEPAAVADLAKGTAAHLGAIDPLIEASAEHWRLSRMAVLDRMIMRLAVYEFLHASTPRAVVIDEALELARTFSGDGAVAFINGVLDDVRRKLDEGSGALKAED